jgi:hypothetical protein
MFWMYNVNILCCRNVGYRWGSMKPYESSLETKKNEDNAKRDDHYIDLSETGDEENVDALLEIGKDSSGGF